VSASETQRAIQAVWKAESPRVIAGLTRIVRDVGLAEELAHDALVAALEQWPAAGVPDNPGAWLMATGKHHAINLLRRRGLLARKHQQLGHDIEAQGQDMPGKDIEQRIDEDVGDDLLRLVFIACHPVLPTEGRVALTLRLLGGLTTDEIARAFLVPEPTVAQRIVRAKRTLAEAEVPFELPGGAELGARLASVLEVIYLVFNEGHAATAGDDLMRPALVDEALRLGRVLAELCPGEPEVQGLLAMMELHASRAPARTGPGGEAILLLDQDRTRWDQLLVRRGLAALARAEAVAGMSASAGVGAGAPRRPPGGYELQAAIAACHTRARTAEETDWTRIAALYGQLAALIPSPVVELNRAVAVGMAEGPAAGLAIIDELDRQDRPGAPSAGDGGLRGYAPLPAARSDLLARLGRFAEAQAEFERAADLTRNARERDVLRARAAACAREAASTP
jgi:RNA polymerase sigma-70 factor (ECF subfamily)